jgi:tetratricopeptide (TPR) repeat protein
MKKHILIITLVATCFLKVFSQDSANIKLDSLKIDSLKKRLPLLSDTLKVDCLNQISDAYVYIFPSQFTSQVDSSYHYAIRASEAATTIGYKKGMGFALLSLTRWELSPYKLNIPLAKKHLNDAIAIGEAINNNDILAGARCGLAGIDLRNNNLNGMVENNKKAIEYFRKAGNEKGELETSNGLAISLLMAGKYEEAFPYCERCEILTTKDEIQSGSKYFGHFLREFALVNMGALYEAAGDYETTMSYYRQARNYALQYKTGWELVVEIGEIFCYMGKYDSAFSYIKPYTNSHPENPWAAATLGQVYLAKKQYDTALNIFKRCIYGEQYRNYNEQENKEGLKRAFLFAGQAYAEKRNYSSALAYLKKGVALAIKDNSGPLLLLGYNSLSSVYPHLGNSDSAYFYLQKYVNLKDSIVTRQFLFRVNNYKKAAEDAKKESRIGFLNRDNKIKLQQLKQEATIRNFIIAAFIALLFAGLYVFRNINLKRKNERLSQEQKEQEWRLKELESENRHVELQKQSSELEMQALRAQMNPHFIFNSLGSINHFILKNDGRTASSYLTRFSRLIRMVLINSQKPLITLSDELEMLRIYLDMERLRFKNSFDYVISFINEIDAESVSVPPLILQPFCENAIWHGLMHKEGHGNLTIDLSMSNTILECVISDNGIGRTNAAKLKTRSDEKEKSMGLHITTQRLALLNQNKNVHTVYTIDDILDEHKNVTGTKVILKISHEEMKKELV